MVISYVIRLRPDALTDGRFVGEIEAVTSRTRRAIHNMDQMAAFILATMPEQVSANASARNVQVDGPESSDLYGSLQLRPPGGDGK